MITAGIWVIIASLVVVTAGLALRLTRDTGTRAAPRPKRGDWDEPAPDPAWPPPTPGEWLPAPPVPEVTHEEDWRAALAEWHATLEERQAHLDEWQDALDERLSGVIVADVYTPTPAGPPGDDYGWREPFAWWLSDTNVGGMLAITGGEAIPAVDDLPRRHRHRGEGGRFVAAGGAS